MSEYQYVVFQAVDAPLNNEQLEFAQQQSSRAEVSRWSLSVEYHYGSFRGDVDGLLRQGYDVYLEYTNYGNRVVKLRLPFGMPCAKKVWSKYVNGRELSWEADATGRGGILTLHPYYESGSLEEVWEANEYLDSAIDLRERLMNGDLRALYLLWLCAANDDDSHPEKMIEPPVPHGIAESEQCGEELLSFYGIDPLLLDAVGNGVAAAPSAESEHQSVTQWVESLDSQQAKDLLQRMLVGDTADEKARLLAEIRDTQAPVVWPTTNKQRTLAELLRRTEILRDEEDKKEARKAQERANRKAAEAERKRAERMQEMIEAPDKWLRKTERLVEARGTQNYEEAAEILFDLGKAVGGDKGEKITRRHAAKLAKKHPTLNRLKSSLRKRGLLE